MINGKIDPSDIRATSKLEEAFSTTRCLPIESEIPQDFHDGNEYTRLAESLFYGRGIPDLKVTIRPEFQDLTGEQIRSFTIAHLRSWEPKHEHKIAGVGYLISQIMEIKP